LGKAFHGPFRITEVSGINVTRDGEVFVQFRDANNNVIGATFALSAFLKISAQMQDAASDVVPEPRVRVMAG
jgi:hypothetical protein